MSFIYPRVASVNRPVKTPTSQVGDVGYNAIRPTGDEATIFTGLICSVQFDRQGQRNGVGLPTDARYQPIWKVLFPLGVVADGAIKSADVIIDDLGRRLQVYAAIPTSLGMECGCLLLEV